MRGAGAWTDRHERHIRLLWAQQRTLAVTEGAWADLKVTTDILDHPHLTQTAEGHDSAMSSAMTSALIALLEAKQAGRRPALVPPLAPWSHQR